MIPLERRFYPESRFGGFTHVDGTIAFYTRVNALLKSTDVVLDIGCGRGALEDDPVPFRRDLRILRGKVAKVVGVDVDDTARGNPFIDEFRMIKKNRWPLGDASIDLAVSDFVVEHVPEPDSFFAEAARVIKPGGYLCIRTPNKNSYFGLAVTLIPNRFHAQITQHTQDGRQEEDVFPTVYRCNTRSILSKTMRRHGFTSVICSHEGEPAYLAFSRLTYWLGVCYQKTVPAALKTSLHGFACRVG